MNIEKNLKRLRKSFLTPESENNDCYFYFGDFSKVLQVCREYGLVFLVTNENDNDSIITVQFFEGTSDHELSGEKFNTPVFPIFTISLQRTENDFWKQIKSDEFGYAVEKIVKDFYEKKKVTETERER